MTDSLADVELEPQPDGRHWRRWLGVVIIGALLLGVGAWVWLGNRGAPRLVVTPPSYDFGQVPSDRVSEAQFTVTNAGTAPLIIESVTTSCGCTQATISSQIIPPGESAQLDVTFDPRVHPDATGPMYRVVYVASDDPVHPETQIELRMNVVGAGKTEGHDEPGG